MKPTKVIEESNDYLVSVADEIYRLSNKYSIDKKDRDMLGHYVDSLMDIQKKLEGMKDNWIAKQELEKKELEKEELEEEIKEKI